MDRLVKNVSPKTLELYEMAWKFFGPQLDTVKLDTKGKKGDARQKAERVLVDAMQISRAMAKLKKRKITANSINIYGRVMCSFLNFLTAEGIISNKFTLKPLEEVTGQRREFFGDTEVTAIQSFRPKSFNQTRAHTIALCMLDCGLRIDEALSLTPDRIDTHSEILKILGKGKKKRIVPMSSMFRLILYRYTQKTAPDFPFVFGTSKGTKMSQRNALRDIKVVLRKAGVRELSWHCFRHTFATGFLRRGGGIHKLQRLLGHEDLKTTEVYLHLVDDYFTEGHDEVSSLKPIRRA